MKKIIKIIFLSCLISTFSCNSPECSDSEQYSLSLKYFKVLKKEYNGGGILVGEALNANLMLFEITGIKSKASYGDVSTYPSNSDYKDDLKSWKHWIDNKSCLTDIQLLKKKETKLLKDLE